MRVLCVRAGCTSDDGEMFFDGEICTDMDIYFKHKNREAGKAGLCGAPEYVQETLSDVTLQECARRCETDIFCDGMNYIWDGRECQLLATTAATRSDGAHPELPPGSSQCAIPGTFEHFVKVNECDLEPCQNGGMCTPGTRSYTCQCMPGWSGENCDEDVDECQVDNGGCSPQRECVNTDGSSTCAATCSAGFEPVGEKDCRDVDECTTRPCISYPDFIDINGATCEGYSQEEQEGTVMCSLAESMETDPDRTAATDCCVCGGGHEPCAGRDGTGAQVSSCVNTPGGFTCDSCDAGFTGDGDNGCHDM
jgi:hypothetical protein